MADGKDGVGHCSILAAQPGTALAVISTAGAEEKPPDLAAGMPEEEVKGDASAAHDAESEGHAANRQRSAGVVAHRRCFRLWVGHKA